jgi:hypothetical protein
LLSLRQYELLQRAIDLSKQDTGGKSLQIIDHDYERALELSKLQSEQTLINEAGFSWPSTYMPTSANGAHISQGEEPGRLAVDATAEKLRAQELAVALQLEQKREAKEKILQAMAQEEARLLEIKRAEEEARRRAEEEARESAKLAEDAAKAAAEAARVAEEEARVAAKISEEIVRQAADDEAKRLAEQEAIKAAQVSEQEAAKAAAEEEARIAEEEAREAAKIAEEIANQAAAQTATRLAVENAMEAAQIAEETAIHAAAEEARKAAQVVEQEAEKAAAEEVARHTEEEAQEAAKNAEAKVRKPEDAEEETRRTVLRQAGKAEINVSEDAAIRLVDELQIASEAAAPQHEGNKSIHFQQSAVSKEGTLKDIALKRAYREKNLELLRDMDGLTELLSTKYTTLSTLHMKSDDHDRKLYILTARDIYDLSAQILNGWTPIAKRCTDTILADRLMKSLERGTNN